MSETDTYTEIELFLRKNQSKTEMSEPLYNTSTIKNQYETKIFPLKSLLSWDLSSWISKKVVLQMLNRYKTDITNVKLVQNQCYKC